MRGLINFSGGLRQDECGSWQKNLTSAFGDYGEHVKLPSLWMYGSNDSVWQGNLADEMFESYTAHGARADMVDFGAYKNDAHRLVGDRDGCEHLVAARVKNFLAEIGMPTEVKYSVIAPQAPAASGFASLEAVTAVPFVDESGREGYRNFLSQYSSQRVCRIGFGRVVVGRGWRRSDVGCACWLPEAEQRSLQVVRGE